MGDGHDALFHDDLAWARALAAAQPAALARYEAELVPMIAAQLGRRGLSDDAIADVQQTLRVRLLVGDGDGPAIARYEGRSALRSWVLVSALREAVRVRRRAQREPAFEDDALMALAERGEPAVLDADRDRYRAAFRVAFRAALQGLLPRDRVLLRMHLLDGLTIDQIGALQGAHRATVARWIERARAEVSRSVRRLLMKQLGVDPFEVEELLRWVHSRIDLSLEPLAAVSTAPAAPAVSLASGLSEH
jgi:RNA polymerase sigma-70 factor (ECF subfamily)